MDGVVTTKGDPSAFAVNDTTAVAADLSAPSALGRAAPTNDVPNEYHSQSNIFVAAQRGDVALIRELIESGRARATDRDEQNITPLHWAAINAQVAACRYLLEQGAEVDALGGDLIATPVQWAARNGYLYVIQLLISHGADPNIRDTQGYNTLHLVTHSSSIMPLLYLLHQPISVDDRDSAGHTALMWAAYQGDALSVELLLKHGANPNTRDDSGLSPLHWAVVRGNKLCIRRLFEKGAEIHAKDNEGRTARDMAVELKSLGAWKRALEEGGFAEDGSARKKPLSERNTKLAIFVMPTIFLYLMFTTLTILPWYTGMILAMAEFFGMHHVVTRVLLNKPTYTESVTASPYFSGIIFGSMVWVACAWVTRLLQQSQSHAFAHLIFALSFGLCAYNFFRAMTLDPGTCPAPQAMPNSNLCIIEDLAAEGRLNGQTFCIQCMARKPLRSKHCRICDNRCKQPSSFIVFVTSLVLGIILFDYLTWASCLLPTSICGLTATDMFLFSVAAWATLQLIWTIVLLASQYLQIARQMTTLEVSNLGRYGFMGGRGGSLAPQMSHRHQHAQRGESEDTLSGDATPVSGHAHAHGHGHAHQHGGGCTGFLLQLLGFDRFTSGKAANGLARAGHAANPFNVGFVGNCRDFWTRGRELGVEYERLYEVPTEGFREARRRREREEAEDGGIGRKGQGLRQKLLMGLGIGGPSGRAGRGGYEPVSQV
ncbi:ankyrin [Gloeopeniophorella convolvens]|nr:ankyrin [Gloeopeniophorella convolvens]